MFAINWRRQIRLAQFMLRNKTSVKEHRFSTQNSLLIGMVSSVKDMLFISLWSLWLINLGAFSLLHIFHLVCGVPTQNNCSAKGRLGFDIAMAKRNAHDQEQ